MSVVKVKGTVMWADLEKPNDLSGKYQVDIAGLSDGAVNALEEMGLGVKSKDGAGYYITCKSTRPILARDNKGATLEGVSVGNGSEAVAAIGYYDWTFKNKEGRSPALKQLVITKLETYDPEGNMAIEDDDEVL